MMNASAADEASLAVPYGTKGSPEREDYQKKQNEITEAFFAYLADEYASDLSARVVSNVRYRAGEASSGSGFSDIEHHYRGFAEFAGEVLADAK